MLKKKKTKFNLKNFLALLCFMAIGFACGILMVVFAEKAIGKDATFEELMPAFLLLFAAMYLSIILHIIIHEAGHLIFGLLSGYKFCSFRIFSFMLLRENGKLKLRSMSVAGTGGQCLMSPPPLESGKIPVVMYNLGGSVLNLAFSVLAIITAILCAGLPALSAVMWLFTIVGIGIALMNGIPMRMGTVDNDGYNALSLGKSKDAMGAFWLQMEINNRISQGIRLRDMPEQWFVFPSDEAMKNSMVATVGVFCCNRLMDQERFKEADEKMEHMLSINSGMPGLYKGALACDRIFAKLIIGEDANTVKALNDNEYRTFVRSMKNFPSVLRTEYAIAKLIEGNSEKACNIKAQFEKTGKKYPYQNEIAAERHLIALVDEKEESAL